KKICAAILPRHAQVPAEETNHPAFLRMHLVFLEKQANARVDQECAERIQHPGKVLDQLRPDSDQDSAHHQRAHHTICEQAVLEPVFHAECAKDHQEKKRSEEHTSELQSRGHLV